MKPKTSETIRELRRVLGLTQAEFAVTIGASKDAVASWETGRNRLSAGMARRMALATGVDERSLRQRGGPLLTHAVPRRPFTGEEFQRHRKSFWSETSEASVRRHVDRCRDALELLFRAAATAGEGEGISRLAGVLDSFIQWCQETRTDFALAGGIDAQLRERKTTLELDKSYAQWRELARTDPETARKFGFKDEAKKGAQDRLKLSMETVPVWMPGRGMRGKQ